MRLLRALALSSLAGIASADFQPLAPRNVMIREAPPIYMAQCPTCCPLTIRHTTIRETYYSTVTETAYKTSIEHEVSTQVQHTTDFVTKTQVSTYVTSYPVTVTSLLNCTKKPVPTLGIYNRDDAPLECETVTSTEWKTTTATDRVVSTRTVLVPTVSVVATTLTDIETVTQIHNQSITSWVPTTYTATVTRTSEYPVTITAEHNVTVTSTTATTETIVTTLTTSYPVVSTATVTQPAVTVTAPGATVIETKSAETVTASGTTVTQPGTTITEVKPVETVTRPGVTITDVKSEETVTQPGTTVTDIQTSTTKITVCPSPTGFHRPLDPQSNLTFGCEPGYVCNPPMPDGCNIWPGPPSDTFVCCESDCIPSPPFTFTNWKANATGYYPPSYGYFNLDPRPFGLSYDIFDLPSGAEDTPHRRGLLSGGIDIQIGGNPCYASCNNVNGEAESVGKSDELCRAGSKFRVQYDACKSCVEGHADLLQVTVEQYVGAVFAQYLNFCNGRRSVPSIEPVHVGGGDGSGPDPAVASQPAVTSSQAGASSASFEPVPGPTQAGDGTTLPGSTTASEESGAGQGTPPVSGTGGRTPNGQGSNGGQSQNPAPSTAETSATSAGLDSSPASQTDAPGRSSKGSSAGAGETAHSSASPQPSANDKPSASDGKVTTALATDGTHTSAMATQSGGVSTTSEEGASLTTAPGGTGTPPVVNGASPLFIVDGVITIVVGLTVAILTC